MDNEDNPRLLLAVDLGLKTGLALFDDGARLIWARSHNFGAKSRLKKAARNILMDIKGLEAVILEGGGELAKAWEHQAEKLGIHTITVSAETWRADMLPPSRTRDSATAKACAARLAQGIAKTSHGRRPTSMNLDAAEAVAIGYWAVTALKILDIHGK